MDAPRWAEILAAARRCRVVGLLAERLTSVASKVPPRVREHFESVAIVNRYRRQTLMQEIWQLQRTLASFPGELILLKGSAYEIARLPMARGRAPSDVDLLVRREHLSLLEETLRGGGWRARQLNRYDDHYYRRWSHELPPFLHPDRGVEVDVHHAITPAVRGGGVSTESVVEASVEVDSSGRRRFRILQPVDQLIHCSLHTFKDSDLSLRLRESMDFDLLYRHYVALNPRLPGELIVRAQQLRQTRPVWWAIHFARRWLGSPIPAWTLDELPAPSAGTVRVMNWLCDRAMLPGERMERAGLDRFAAIALLARYQYQRLPLTKLIPHVLEKSKRRLLRPKEQPDAP